MSSDRPKAGGRVWVFAGRECDELRRELRVNGSVVDMEPKPFDILLELLEQYPNVVPKKELKATIWEGSTVVENSLPTAISKLRKSLGDDDHTILETVHAHGYKIAAEVRVREVVAEVEPVGLKAGDRVPERDAWSLIRRLGPSEASDVWLAVHRETGEERVFKFAADGVRLRYLKREAALFRYLKKMLGEPRHFVRVLDWNFAKPPYFLASEAGGPNLSEWAESRGGPGHIPLSVRLKIMAEIATAVSIAHGVGVIHRDLKPANILLSQADDGYRVRIVDFGSGGLLEHPSPGMFEITDLEFSQPLEDSGAPISATVMYAAPELLKGQPATASADVYALGVILFQMVVGDFHRQPMPGWEQSVSDPLLREDIALAASGDSQKRLGSAAELAERLTALDLRRAKRDEELRVAARARELQQALRRAEARRPWMLTAGAVLLAGLAASLVLYGQAVRERNRANRQSAIAASINRFVAQDLLARADPFHAGKPDETLVGAVKRAASDIDRQFAGEPEVAARLHETIAAALARRDEPTGAIQEYERAAALYVRDGGKLSPDGVVERLQGAMVETRSMQPASIEHARLVLNQQQALVRTMKDPRPDLAVWIAMAGGLASYAQNDAASAARSFQVALTKAQTVKTFDTNQLLNIKHSLAAAWMRLSEPAKSEPLAREVLAAYTRIYGQNSPPTLQVRLLLAQCLVNQGKHEEVVRETSSLYPAFVATLGEDHQLTLQVLLTRAASEDSLERWDAAIEDDMTAHRLALARFGPANPVSVVSLSDASDSQCRAGRLAEGARSARSALEAARKAFGQHGGLPDAAAFALATCLIPAGQVEEAARLLVGIDPSTMAQLTGDAAWGANLALAQGQVAWRRGQFEAARKYLDTARPGISRPEADPYQKRAFETLRTALAVR